MTYKSVLTTLYIYICLIICVYYQNVSSLSTSNRHIKQLQSQMTMTLRLDAFHRVTQSLFSNSVDNIREREFDPHNLDKMAISDMQISDSNLAESTQMSFNQELDSFIITYNNFNIKTIQNLIYSNNIYLSSSSIGHLESCSGNIVVIINNNSGIFQFMVHDNIISCYNTILQIEKRLKMSYKLTQLFEALYNLRVSNLFIYALKSEINLILLSYFNEQFTRIHDIHYISRYAKYRLSAITSPQFSTDSVNLLFDSTIRPIPTGYTLPSPSSSSSSRDIIFGDLPFSHRYPVPITPPRPPSRQNEDNNNTNTDHIPDLTLTYTYDVLRSILIHGINARLSIFGYNNGTGNRGPYDTIGLNTTQWCIYLPSLCNKPWYDNNIFINGFIIPYYDDGNEGVNNDNNTNNNNSCANNTNNRNISNTTNSNNSNNTNNTNIGDEITKTTITIDYDIDTQVIMAHVVYNVDFFIYIPDDDTTSSSMSSSSTRTSLFVIQYAVDIPIIPSLQSDNPNALHYDSSMTSSSSLASPLFSSTQPDSPTTPQSPTKELLGLTSYYLTFSLLDDNISLKSSNIISIYDNTINIDDIDTFLLQPTIIALQANIKHILSNTYISIPYIRCIHNHTIYPITLSHNGIIISSDIIYIDKC